LRPSVANIPKIRDEKAKMREAVIANVRQQVQNVKKSASVQRGSRGRAWPSSARFMKSPAALNQWSAQGRVPPSV